MWFHGAFLDLLSTSCACSWICQELLEGLTLDECAQQCQGCSDLPSSSQRFLSETSLGINASMCPPRIFRDFPNQLEAIASRVEAIAVKLILRCATPVCLWPRIFENIHGLPESVEYQQNLRLWQVMTTFGGWFCEYNSLVAFLHFWPARELAPPKSLCFVDVFTFCWERQ